MIGPVFYRELVTMPRRLRLYLVRAVYAAGLLLLMATAWLVLTGAQVIRSPGDMARFGAILLGILAPLQIALVGFLAALAAASAISQEKDRRTLLLLLMTRMSNSELVLGKLMASLLPVISMVAAGLPIFMLSVLFGGIEWNPIWRILAVTLVTMLAAGSLGAMLAFWRENTFQTLAITAVVLCFWLGLWEAVANVGLNRRWLGASGLDWANTFSPVRAVLQAAHPNFQFQWGEFWQIGNTGSYLLTLLGIAGVLIGLTILRVRVWNPSPEVRRSTRTSTDERSVAVSTVNRTPHRAVTGSGGGGSGGSDFAVAAAAAETAREGHVDSRLRQRTRQASDGGRALGVGASRPVWDNPVLWREVRTWAYGRKVMALRIAYLLLVAMAVAALHFSLPSIRAARLADDNTNTVVPIAAKPLAPLCLVSLVILNALAVTSVTTERDTKSLDLLLATDLSPHEFVFGKLGGVFSVAGLMVLCPIVLALYLWGQDGLGTENLMYVLGGLMVMNLFVAMLGVHCGMRYSNSRTAIGVSLGTVFFLFMGVVACVLMMISFSSSFQVQLAPFLAFIGGGGVGLYVALGARNASKAITLSAMLVPFMTFCAITSFLLRHNLEVFLICVCCYGFATAAMMIPALYEFDFAMGRTSHPQDS